jgi:hypothetical protein
MDGRDDLHSLLDRLPEEMVRSVRVYLESLLRPRPPRPEIEQSRDRGREFRKMVERRFQETRQSGTISVMTGGGSLFPKDGETYGRNAFHYWDDKALVHQTLQFFAGQELEMMERMSRSDDGATLIYDQELSSGGRTVRNKVEFPFITEGKQES